MRAISILGLILIAVGITSLAYFEDPVRLMFRDFQAHKTNLVPPILCALALIGGVALLFARQRKS
jgi:hypothetical protein